MAFALWSCVLSSLIVAAAAQAVVQQLETTLYPPTLVTQVPTQAPVAFDPLATNAPMTPAPGVLPLPVTNPGGTLDVAKATEYALNGDNTALQQDEANAIAETPQAAGNFCSGFIRGYFAKVTLEPGEKVCIESQTQHITQAGVGLIETLAQLIGQLVAKQTPNALLGVTGAGQVLEIVTKAQYLVRTCIREDTMAVMKVTAAHLKNTTYMNGRLLANGIDIATALADSITTYMAGNFEKVGWDYGTLLRKILLSKNTGTTKMVLPENVDKTVVGQDVADGVIAGLFIEGAAVTITSKAQPPVQPAGFNATPPPYINIHVDLHKCIAMEAPYLTSALNALYLAVAQITTNIEQWQLQRKGVQTGYIMENPHPSGNGQVLYPASMGVNGQDLNWMNHLAGLMSNIPVLMDRCGFTAEQRTMMADALKSMDSVSMAFTIPGPPNRAEAASMASLKLENATHAWEAGEYKWFGFYVGGLMRDLLLTVYPEKYTFDNGELRKKVDGERKTAQIGDVVHNPVGSLSLWVGAFAAVMLVGLSLIRVARPHTRSSGDDSLLQTEADLGDDMEAHHNDQAVE